MLVRAALSRATDPGELLLEFRNNWLRPQLAVGIQADLCCVHLPQSAAFLFHQVVLRSPDALSSREYLRPLGHAVPKENLISLIRRPVFQMQRTNAPRV